MRPLALGALAAGLLLAPKLALAFPAVLSPPTAAGARWVDESTGALRLVTALEPGATAYGLSLGVRTESGFVIGAGVHPGHRQEGPREVTLGFAGQVEVGWSPCFTTLELGAAELRWGGGFRALGQAGLDALETKVFGAAFLTALELRGDDASGLESAQVFVEYRPVLAGLRDGEDELRTALHGLRLGGAVLLDIGFAPGMGSALLLGAALDVRSLEEAQGTGLTAELGVAF